MTEQTETPERNRRQFWFGWVAALASYGLFQDVIGKARYIRMVNDGWVSGWWTIPLEVATIIFCVWAVI